MEPANISDPLEVKDPNASYILVESTSVQLVPLLLDKNIFPLAPLKEPEVPIKIFESLTPSNPNPFHEPENQL